MVLCSPEVVVMGRWGRLPGRGGIYTCLGRMRSVLTIPGEEGSESRYGRVRHGMWAQGCAGIPFFPQVGTYGRT